MKTININVDVTAASAEDLWAKVARIEQIASPDLLAFLPDLGEPPVAAGTPGPTVVPFEKRAQEKLRGSMVVPEITIDPGVTKVTVPISGSCPVPTDGFHFAVGLYGDVDLLGSRLGPFFNEKVISAGIKPIHVVNTAQNGRPVRYVEYGVTLMDINNGNAVPQFTVPENTVLAELDFAIDPGEQRVTLWLQQNFFRSGPHVPGSLREWNEFTNRLGRPFRNIDLVSGSIVRD